MDHWCYSQSAIQYCTCVPVLWNMGAPHQGPNWAQVTFGLNFFADSCLRIRGPPWVKTMQNPALRISNEAIWCKLWPKSMFWAHLPKTGAGDKILVFRESCMNSRPCMNSSALYELRGCMNSRAHMSSTCMNSRALYELKGFVELKGRV